MAHGYSFSTVLFVVFESLAIKTFNHVVRLLVARLYNVYVRLLLMEEKWKLKLREFIVNYEFSCVGAWDGFHVLCNFKLKQFYHLKKHYAVTNLELVENNIFLNKIDCFKFLIENLLDERKHFIFLSQCLQVSSKTVFFVN